MDVGDLVTIILIFVALWTFIPRHIRHALKSGLEPSIIVLSDAIRELTHYGWKLFTHIIYRLLIGHYPDDNVIVNQSDDDADYVDIAPVATTPQNNNNGIATPAMDSNALLLQAKAESLAKMVKAGKIGETDGIKLIFEVSPSSSNPRYIAARAALKTALEKLDNPYPHRTAEQAETRNVLGLETRLNPRAKAKT